MMTGSGLCKARRTMNLSEAASHPTFLCNAHVPDHGMRELE